MDEATIAGFLDELTKIGGVPPLGPSLGAATKSLAHHGLGAVGTALQGTRHLWGALREGSQAAAHRLESTGGRLGRAAGAGLRLAPYAGVLYGGHKLLNSSPVQAMTGQPTYYQGGY